MGQTPKFQLVQFETAATVAVKPAEQDKPVGKGTETLVVNISQFLAKFRRVLAVPAAVNKVIITVTAADGTVFTQILDLAALAAGQTSVTFNGLVPGEATILIEAYNAANQVIGFDSATAMIVPGVVATKDMALQVKSPSASGGGGTGGGSVPAVQPPPTTTPGGVQARVDVYGTPVVKALPFPANPDLNNNRSLSFASNGDIWGLMGFWYDTFAMSDYVTRHTSSGRSYDVGDVYESSWIVLDHHDHKWAIDGRALLHYSEDNALIGTYALNPPGVTKYWLATTQMVVDPANHVWFAVENRLLRVSQAGTFVVDVPLPDRAGMMVCDQASGAVWVAPERGNWLIKAMPDGTTQTITLTPATSWNGNGMDVDASGDLLLPRRSANEVLRIAPDGTIEARIPASEPTGLAIDPAGHIWIHRLDGVFKLEPTGGYSEGYAIDKVERLTHDRTGNVWVESRGPVMRISP